MLRKKVPRSCSQEKDPHVMRAFVVGGVGVYQVDALKVQLCTEEPTSRR